jgi:hypothetical protein
MKSGEINHYVVNWYNFYTNIAEELSQLYLNVSGAPRLYVDNTLEFVNWLIKEKKASISK